jgi:uncharacterized membrane protein (DUF485 family)
MRSKTPPLIGEQNSVLDQPLVLQHGSALRYGFGVSTECLTVIMFHGLAQQNRVRILKGSMPPTPPARDDVVHSEGFLRALMRRQLGLSISCAVAFLVALLGLPLLNYFAPALMATRVAGFTLSWLVLGVLFFPFVWVISYVFIQRSIALEEDEVQQARAGKETR